MWVMEQNYFNNGYSKITLSANLLLQKTTDLIKQFISQNFCQNCEMMPLMEHLSSSSGETNIPVFSLRQVTKVWVPNPNPV